jgi:hypothetical protein
MKPEQIEKYRKAADEGTIPDAENPLFLFQGISTKLLVMGLNKEIGFAELARHELSARGLSLKGEWVGFDQKPQHKKPARKKGRHL